MTNQSEINLPFFSELIKDINEISAWVTWADMELRSYLPRVPFLPAGPTGPLGKKGTLGSNMIKTWMIKVGLPVLLLWVFSNVDPNLYQFFGNKLFLKIVKTLSRLFLFFFFVFHNFVIFVVFAGSRTWDSAVSAERDTRPEEENKSWRTNNFWAKNILVKYLLIFFSYDTVQKSIQL